MKTQGRFFRLAILPASLLAAFGTAMAEDDEVDQYIKPDSSVSVGVGVWSGDRHQQGIFDGMRDDKAYGLLDAEVSKRDDTTGTWYMLNAKNLGLDSRELRVDLFRQGDVGGFLEYSRTPRDNPYTIVTPLQGIGTSTVTVGTVSGGVFTAREVEIGTNREMLRLGGFKNLLPGLDLKIDFKHEDKKGTRQMGWGSAALFSVEPINSTTRQLEVTLQYTGDHLQLSGGYYGSWYDNKYNQLLEVLNGITGGTSAGFNSVTPISLPLDNQAHQLFFDGGYSFSPTTRGTFKMAYTHATQNEHLPSIDLGGANAPFINAPSNLNGKVDTTLLQFGLTSKPMPKLNLNASLRYHDVDDKTPLAGYVGNNGTGVATVFNTPLSYTTISGKLEASYSLPMNFKVTGGLDHSQQDRGYPIVGTQYVPYRTSLKETTYRIQLRRLLAEGVNGSLAYLRSERDGSGFTTATYDNAVNPQINPIHIADRNRDKVRAAVDWDANEIVSLQFRADYSRDKYPDNGQPYGVKDGTSELYGVDANFAISDNWSVAAWYSYDLTKAREVGVRLANSGTSNAVKEARLKDVGESFGLNLKGKLSSRFEMNAGFDWFSNTSSYPQDITFTGVGTVAYPTSNGGATGPLPDIKNNLLRLKLDGKYMVDKKSDIQVSFIHERWNTNDWSWSLANGSPFSYFTGNITCTGCTTTPAAVVDGTSVSAKAVQTANFLGVRYLYKFQ